MNNKNRKMKGEDRKRSIIKAAVSVFAETGFYGSSVKRIAQEAKISEALLYQHFESKESL